MVRKFVLHVIRARLAIHVRNLHAARIVQQHAEEILLGTGGAHDQQRAEQADQNNRQDREPDARERHTIALAAASGSIRQDGQPGADAHEAAARYEPVVGAKRYSPWLKTTGDSSKKNRKMASNTEFLRILLRPTD